MKPKNSNHWKIIPLFLLLVLSVSLVIPSTPLDADSFSVQVVDSDNNVIDRQMFSTTVYFDTETTPSGIVYTLPENTEIQCLQETFLKILADDGLYNVRVTATNVTNLIQISGLRISLSYGGNTYHADLLGSNTYSSLVYDGTSTAVLDHDKKYQITASTASDYGDRTVPRLSENLSLTFEAIPISGYNAAIFMNGEVESYVKIVKAGDPLGQLPAAPESTSSESFAGWFDSNNVQATSTTIITGETTYYARWHSGHSIQFVNDGTLVDTRTIDDGSRLGTLPTDPVKENYDFMGWYATPSRSESEIKADPDLIITTDLTFNARWQSNFHTVNFYDGATLLETRTLSNDQTIGSFPDVPDREGMYVSGWADENRNPVYVTTKGSELPRTVNLHPVWAVIPDPEPEPEPPIPPVPEDEYTKTVEEIENEDSLTEIITEVLERVDGTKNVKVTEFTVDNELNTREVIIETEFDKNGMSTKEDNQTTAVTNNDDGTKTVEHYHYEKDYDGSEKITEYIRKETSGDIILDIEQKVIYVNTEGDSREYTAVGNQDRVEIIMPDTTKIDVDYAKDSISDVSYDTVIVGVSFDTGVLEIPEDTLGLIAEYGYFTSVTNGDERVVLDSDVMSNLSSMGGDALLTVNKATPEDMTDQQGYVVGENYAISIRLTVNGESVSQLGGQAEITVDPGYVAAHVYYVDADGNTEEIDSSYDPETGKVSFGVWHFSIYMMTLEHSVVEDDSNEPFIIFIIAIVAMFAPLAYIRILEVRERD